MDPADHRAHLLTQRNREGREGRFHHGDVETSGVQTGGDLAADEAGTDHHRGARAVDFRTQRQRIIDRAQHVHAGLPTGERQSARVQTGRQHERAVREGLGRAAADRFGGDRVRRGIDCDDPGSGSQVHLLVVIELGRFEIDPVLIADEHRLRQRRTVIGRVLFLTDQYEVPVVSLITEIFDQSGSPEPGSDNHDRGAHRHLTSWIRPAH